MLVRRHRFHGPKGLNDTYRQGQTLRAGVISAKYRLRDARKPYRVAVVVSKKVHKSAVTRNRIRRRLYELVRTHESGLPEGLDLVITVYGEQVATMPAPELKALVDGLLRKLPAVR